MRHQRDLTAGQCVDVFCVVAGRIVTARFVGLGCCRINPRHVVSPPLVVDTASMSQEAGSMVSISGDGPAGAVGYDRQRVSAVAIRSAIPFRRFNSGDPRCADPGSDS